MVFLDSIKEKTIIVCPSNVKSKLLNEINKIDSLINVKIYSLDELKRIVYFDYDINTILYLMDKKDYSYDTAKYYIDNLYYVEDKFYDNSKLDFLVNLKKELIDNDLLSFNKLFINSYKNTKFIVFGYDYIDSFNKKILSNFNYEVINSEVDKKDNYVYKFNTLEDELLFTINRIITLIDEGVDINNIYLLNIDSNYKDEIIRLFNMFNIPVDIDNSSSIISTITGNNIFNKLKETESFEETVKYMDSLNINQSFYNTILNIFNKYVDLDYSFKNILKCVRNDFETTVLKTNTLKNSVKIGELYNSYYDKDDYVFLLGFNQGSIPKVFKDEDYISDDLKEILGLDSTKKLNKERIKSTTNNINRIKNITITYKKHYLKEEFYPSNLLSEDSYIEKESNELNTDRSNIYSKIKLTKMLDNLINYDEKNEELQKYFNSINDIRYMEYDNKYKSIDKKVLHDKLNNNLLLSYSSIDKYFRCHFRYFINSILKIDKFEDSFDTFIGSLFHYVLSKIDDKDFDFEKEYNEYLKKRKLTNKEKFYLDKLKDELKFICDFIISFNNDTLLKEMLFENEFPIDKSTNDMKIIFKGFVDKIMYIEKDDKTLVSIIDYKTGNTDIKLEYAKEGIGLQLFIYMYLIAKSKEIKNPFFVGFYLQNILNEIKIKENKTYLEQKLDELKLHGYSTDNREYLEMFDPTYKDSKYIQSMSITAKDEFYRYSKVLDEDSMNKIIDFIDKKVDEARDGIVNGDFSINPKYFYGDKESIGCKNCNYSDICFMRKDDYKYYNKNTSFDFLKEGEENA